MNKENIFQLKIVNLIMQILDRPALYQVNKVEDLYYIILGFTIAKHEESSNNLLNAFREFVNIKFESSSDFDWYRLIRLYSASDAHSLELFKINFNEFLELKTK